MRPTWDAVIVGSGFGGAMAAHALVNRGWRVLMIERGGWVARGPDNWGPRGAAFVSAHFNNESPFRVRNRFGASEMGSVALTLKLAPYDASWPSLFEAEAARLRESLESNASTVEHIGTLPFLETLRSRKN